MHFPVNQVIIVHSVSTLLQLGTVEGLLTADCCSKVQLLRLNFRFRAQLMSKKSNKGKMGRAAQVVSVLFVCKVTWKCREKEINGLIYLQFPKLNVVPFLKSTVEMRSI